MGERLRYTTGKGLGYMVRAWRLTVQRETRNREAIAGPCVIAIWHGRMIGMVMDHVGSRLVTMSSRSSDGALGAGAVAGLGMEAVRGSTKKGGREALMEMGRAVGARAPYAALTVDGPHGPWRVVQPGAVVLARRLRLPLVPASFSCRRGRVLGTWDRLLLPAPFSRLVVAYGEPWSPERLRQGRVAEVCAEFAAALDDLTATLDREVAGIELWSAT